MAASLSASAVVQRLSQGDVLHMELQGASRQWWFEAPYAIVSDAVVSRLMQAEIAKGTRLSVRLAEAGDSLFGLPLNSQTWFAEPGQG